MMLYYSPIDCLLIGCMPPPPIKESVSNSSRRLIELEGAVEREVAEELTEELDR